MKPGVIGILSLLFYMSTSFPLLTLPTRFRFSIRNTLRSISNNVENENKKSPQKWAHRTKYVFGKHIGSGKYSNVISGYCRQTGRPVAIKILKPCPFWKIQREINVLQTLEKGPHILKLVDKIYDLNEIENVGNISNKHEDGKCYGLVFDHCGPPTALTAVIPSVFDSTTDSTTTTTKPFFTSSISSSITDAFRRAQGWVPFAVHNPPRRLSHRGLAHDRTYSDIEVRWAMYQLLESLQFTHSKNVMHRDLKPANILVKGRGFPKLKITVGDWGLADFDLPGVEHGVRVASRPFKAPELLLGDRRYDCSMDLWSTGCVFAGLLFRKDPFLRGLDNEEQITKIAQVLGSDGFKKYSRKFLKNQSPITNEMIKAIGNYPKLTWKEYVKSIIIYEQKEEDINKNNNKKDDKKQMKINKKNELLKQKLNKNDQINMQIEEYNKKNDDDNNNDDLRISEFEIAERMKLANPEGLDLLDKMLEFDRMKRISASQALQHDYFIPIKKLIFEYKKRYIHQK